MLQNLKLKSVILSIFFIFLTSCGGGSYFPDARKQPVNAEERVKKNISEGRGLKLTTSLSGKNGGGNFTFASSNPLWRATLEKLDFMPLSNVDYAGGIIITDWYGDIQSNEQIKVAVRFLTNEIRSDALDIIIYKKECNDLNNCQTQKINNSTNEEIKASILKRAVIISKEEADVKK
jgi:hypothetical protein